MGSKKDDPNSASALASKNETEDQTLQSIPTTKWARTSKLTKLTASLGAAALGQKVSQVFTDSGVKKAKQQLHQIRQATKIVETLSQMKGAAMKLGQILSMHGDTLFPSEVTEILSKLQAQSHSMIFEEIEKVLIEELGEQYKEKLLDFSKRPIASASIGQVHKASLIDGTWVAVKIQYPGVSESIDADVDALAGLLRFVAKLPSAESFDDVIQEIKEVLRLETDYLEEARHYQFFKEYFTKVDHIYVPHVYSAVSSKKILTTEFIKGKSVQEYAQGSASVEHRKLIGETFMRVFYHELFRLGLVQTDPNFGNYKILEEQNKLVLFDFGAVKKFSEQWRQQYIQMIQSAYNKDFPGVLEHSYELGFIRVDDSQECKELHLKLCEMFLEPFRVSGEYAFDQSDLPQRMRALIPQIIAAFKFRSPPRHIIFLNRKIVGTYFFLSTIKARFKAKPLLEEFLKV